MANNLHIYESPSSQSLSETPMLYFVGPTSSYELYDSSSVQFHLNVKIWTGDRASSSTSTDYFLSAYPKTSDSALGSSNQETIFDISPIVDSYMTQSVIQASEMLTDSGSQGLWYLTELSASYLDTGSNTRIYLNGVSDYTKWAQGGYIPNEQEINGTFLSDKPYQWSWSSTGARFNFLFRQDADPNGVSFDTDAPNYRFQRDNYMWYDWYPITWFAATAEETISIPGGSVNIFYDPNATLVCEFNSVTESIQLNGGTDTTNQWRTAWIGGSSLYGNITDVDSYRSADSMVIYMALSGSYVPQSNKIRINNKCAELNQSPYRIYYKNSLGALDWFDFSGTGRQSMDIQRDTFNRSPFVFKPDNTIDRYKGNTSVYNSNARNRIVLNTGWLNEWDRVRIEDILLSDEIWLYPLNYTSLNISKIAIANYRNQNLIPLTIEDNNVVWRTSQEDKVQQNYTLTFGYDQKYKATY